MICSQMLGAYLGKNLSKATVYLFLMKFVTVELQPFDQFLHGSFGFERQKRQAEGNVSPLSRIFGKAESLAKLVNYVLRLFFLQDVLCQRKYTGTGAGHTFSMNEKIYFMVLWKVSSSTAWSPVDRWLMTVYERMSKTFGHIQREGTIWQIVINSVLLC
jgi:hypothetical protein